MIKKVFLLACVLSPLLVVTPSKAYDPIMILEWRQRQCSKLFRDYFRYSRSHPSVAESKLEEMKKLQCAR